MRASNLQNRNTLELFELVQLKFVHRIYCIESYHRRSLKSRLDYCLREGFFLSSLIRHPCRECSRPYDIPLEPSLWDMKDLFMYSV